MIGKHAYSKRNSHSNEKRQLKELEKIFASYTDDKGLKTRYTKSSKAKFQKKQQPN
jgi:hypothetical protein